MTSQLLVLAEHQNRLALGIIRAYTIMHPKATLADVRAAFPRSLHTNPGVKELFADVTRLSVLQNPTWKGFFNKAEELITLKDGTRMAVTSMWPADDLGRLVSAAARLGIIAAPTAPVPQQPFALPGDKTFVSSSVTGYCILYLNGFNPAKPKSALMLEAAEDIRDFFRHIEESSSEQKRNIFFNERDLQMHLAIWLKTRQTPDDMPKYDDVEVEYTVPVTMLPQEPWMPKDMHIDIVAERAGQFVPIELKYVTEATHFSFTRFGQAVPEEAEALKDQTAYNNRMYDF